MTVVLFWESIESQWFREWEYSDNDTSNEVKIKQRIKKQQKHEITLAV